MATEVPLIDYYKVLNLPHRVDLAGIENAYARLSAEYATRSEIDETSRDALFRVNEAYAVLSRAELRRAYDNEFFHDARVAAERQRKAERRRRQLTGHAMVGSLALMVVLQAGALAWVGREAAFSIFRAIASAIV